MGVIYRRGQKIASVNFQSSTSVKREVGEVSSLDLSFTTSKPLAIQRGDYVIVDSESFVFDSLPSVDKKSGGEYEYNATLKGDGAELSAYLFMFLDEDGAQEKIYCTSATFDLAATVEEVLSLICRNVNRNVTDKWGYYVASDVDRQATYDLTFDGVSCLDALNTLCDDAEIEWQMKGRTICVGKRIERKTGLKFSYPTNLLSPIELTRTDTDETCTRLFVFGGESNIPSDYNDGKSTRLLMRGKMEYLERSENYTIERIKTFDEVYPRYNGAVTSVRWSGEKTASDGTKSRFCYISDSLMNFNLEQCLNSNTAKVSFKSGMCVGYEFEVASYDYYSQTIELKQQQDGDIIVPNESICPKVGDSFCFIDIDMPDEYVTNAEEELYTKAKEYFDKYCLDNTEAEIEVSSIWLRNRGLELKPYQMVTLVDSDLSLNKEIRIKSVTRYPFDDGTYGAKTEVKLADFVTKSLFTTMSGTLSKVQKNVYNHYKSQKVQNDTTNIEVNSIGDIVDWNESGFGD